MKNRFVGLLIAVLLQLIIYPVVLQTGFLRSIVWVTLSLAPLAVINALSVGRRRMIIALALGLPFLLTGAVHTYVDSTSVVVLNALLAFLFYGYAVLVILHYIRGAGKVDIAIIAAAADAYFLIGLTWFGIYELVFSFQPRAFSGVSGRASFLYYSFIILTNTGTGPIRPESNLAQSITILEAVTGVFYVAVVVALLIGIFTIQAGNRRKDQLKN